MEGLIKKGQLIRTTGGKRMVHIASCPYIQDWDISGCEFIDKVKYNKMALCPTCEKLVYIAEGAIDFEKKMTEYEKIFASIASSKVHSLYVNQKAKTQLVNKKLYLRTKTDSWYIDFSLQEIRLFHGNYDVSAREEDEDDFSKIGYHEHKTSGTFNSAISQIVRYDYKQAEKKHKKARKKQRKIKFSDLVGDSDYDTSDYDAYSEYMN